jgi:hypothetical protein
MTSENELMQRLMVSKRIMEKHNDMGRGQGTMDGDYSIQDNNGSSNNSNHASPRVENFQPMNATYNLPNDLLQETQESRPTQSHSGPPTADRISNSKLPDEIKRLMMEHPIQQPTMGMGSGSVISDELVEKASRLMKTNAKGDIVNEQIQKRQPQQQTQQPSLGLSSNDIRDIVRETVEDVLKENGLLVESESRSSDLFKFRVGQHLFEGKVLKVKKVGVFFVFIFLPFDKTGLFLIKKQKTAKELWEYDKNKIDLTIEKGYILEIMWESDFYDLTYLKKIIKKYERKN